ncbi:hypothetical protein HNP65_001565 [Thermosipho japonicus]|uniref:Uncharacterized protein n=1 Tax=Thermosipho japonicus TaxID=90323 RepID=A0A841GHK1_9BACT|nr:type II secretion system protein [Thermosipho japonicus]MBB6063102.1 hypothetical protein [Thermosipho japonicus]
MTYVEVLIVIVISLIVFSVSIFSLFSILDKVVLEEELFKTIVYCGLWKSNADMIEYNADTVKIYYSLFTKKEILIRKKIYFGDYFEDNNLRIIPRKSVTSGTFGNFKIEPISFDVSVK